MFWVLFIGAGMVSWALCHPIGTWLRKQKAWDLPNPRSSHDEPTLRGGGLSALVVYAFGLGGWVCFSEPNVGISWLIAIYLLGYVSFQDDKRGVSIKIRLAAQIIASIVVWGSMGAAVLPVWQIVLGVCLLVAFTNFVNFMDGINGLAAGQLILMPLGAALLYGVWEGQSAGIPLVMALVMAGAIAGFLPFNFPRSKMFLGDVGSVPLGFSCGVLLAWMGIQTQHEELCFSLMPLTMYFFMEGGITLLRRMWRREKWWQPHREHFYQYLIRAGWSHTRTAGTIWVLQCVVTVLVCWQFQSGWSTWLLWSATVLVWGGFFLYAELVFRRWGQSGGN